MTKLTLEQEFQMQLRGAQVRAWRREYVFLPGRAWRFDFAWPTELIAVEIQGGGHGGAHARPAGYRGDCQKHNAAACTMGWRVLRGTAEMVRSGELIVAVTWCLQSTENGWDGKLPAFVAAAGLKDGPARRKISDKAR